ncbi:MAG: hypothetical protein HY369_03320 [Candidatus Aenigmarchaeota archaeon]|nr:hypothetical protein [Candidatus Aenigmarchaeota archaeon]
MGRRNRSRKGQLVFEFVVAAIVFIGIVVFVLNTLNSTVSLFSDDYLSTVQESKAIAASEILVKTNGSIGFAAAWPVLSATKMAAFNATCTNAYETVRHDLDLLEKPAFGDYQVRVEVAAVDGSLNAVSCGPPLPKGVDLAAVRRIALGDTGMPLAVQVWVW